MNLSNSLTKFSIVNNGGYLNVLNESTGKYLRTKAGWIRNFKTRNGARKEISRERARLEATSVSATTTGRV